MFNFTISVFENTPTIIVEVIVNNLFASTLIRNFLMTCPATIHTVIFIATFNLFDIFRGGSTWKPSVVPTASYPTPSPNINNISPITKTSLSAKSSENIGSIGTGHNLSAKPFSPQVSINFSSCFFFHAKLEQLKQIPRRGLTYYLLLTSSQ